MRIHDLRPWYERAVTRFWAKQTLGSEVGPWDRLLGQVTARRVAGRSEPPSRPFVISVGNICLGGSGKTPVAGRLAADLAASGLAVGILVRGYRSSVVGPIVVDETCTGCGDEARWLASQLKTEAVMVVQALDRAAGFAFMLDRNPALDCVIIEDGFQTRDLGRHLDVLILDAWRDDGAGKLIPESGPVLPFGPWRETVTAVSRADVLVVEEPSLGSLVGPTGQAVLTFKRRSRLVTPQGEAGSPVEGEKWAAISGIARPGGFEQSAAAMMKQDPHLVVRGPDHEAYGARRMAWLEQTLAVQGISTVVTTAKDWVKLSGRIPSGWRVLLVVQDVVWGAAQTLPDYVRKRLSDQAEGGGLV